MAQHTRYQAVWPGEEQAIHWGGLKTTLGKAVVRPAHSQLEEGKTTLG